MMTSLGKLLDAIPAAADETAGKDDYFEQFGLVRNPFPPSRTIIPELLYDQEEAQQRFASLVRAVLDPIPQRRAAGILGGTGGGKTHLLRHCQHEFAEFCRKHERWFVAVEFQAGSGSMQALVKELFNAADMLCREDLGEFDFITAIIKCLRENRIILEMIRQDDLRSALGHLLDANEPTFVPLDRDRQYTFDRLREIFKRWLSGGTLSMTERKYLGVFGRISTGAMAVRVCREMFHLARKGGLFEGVLLCLDEMETLFTGGLRFGRVQGFLQDLRYFYDEAVKSNEGYSLLILSASTPEGATNLREYNYPLYQRLGFEGDSRIELKPIRGVEDATQFAYAYIDYAHQDWSRKRKTQSSKDSKEIVFTRDIEAAFNATTSREGGRAQVGTVTVNQAPLLEQLHLIVEQNKRAQKR